MKRWLVCLLALTLLTGCTQEKPQEDTMDTASVTQTDPGTYDSENPIELQTNGAVRAYDTDPCHGFGYLGEDIVTITYRDDCAVLTKLTGENRSIAATAVVPESVSPALQNIRFSGQSVCYYDPESNSVTFLDSMLRELSTVVIPGDPLQAQPVISEDMNTVYYCTGNEIRAFELNKGISRLVRQQNCASQSAAGVYFDDSILCCLVQSLDGSYAAEFFSTVNGELLGMDSGLQSMQTWTDTYYLQRTDGASIERVLGNTDGTLRVFAQDETFYPGEKLAVGVYEGTQATELYVYDLATGRRSAGIQLPGIQEVCVAAVDDTGEYVWFATTSGGLYRWEVAASPTADETVYITPRYTAQNPDTESLAQCQSRAEALETAYGVDICLLQEAAQPTNTTFDYEYQPQAFHQALDALEPLLAKFPEGFLSVVAQVSDSGKIHIGLVRDIQSEDTADDEVTGGIQYWHEGNAYMVLRISENMTNAFYHQFGHILEGFVLANTSKMDLWDQLNPAGFSYFGNFTDYATCNKTSLIEGSRRAFVDYYAMSYAREDRARIMEYFLQDGCEEYFASATMQQKLRQLCVAIRDAFGWKKDERTFPWEQYLDRSLAYTKKK